MEQQGDNLQMLARLAGTRVLSAVEIDKCSIRVGLRLEGCVKLHAVRMLLRWGRN